VTSPSGFSLHQIEPDPTADAYTGDPRVSVNADKSFYTVTHPDAVNGTYFVAHTAIFGWTLCQGPNLDFVQLDRGGLSDGHFAAGYASAGEVIHALIGAPQT
jgi:hypothetical protein